MFARVAKNASNKLLALDALRANVMLADNNLNMIYLNPALRDLLHEAETDLKKELPRFSMATLIGSNIDIFYKSPSHRRPMLSTLQTRRGETIWVGKRAFDLLFTPLIDGGRRVGFVVEWANAAERLLNIDYEARVDAFGRSPPNGSSP